MFSQKHKHGAGSVSLPLGCFYLVLCSLLGLYTTSRARNIHLCLFLFLKLEILLWQTQRSCLLLQVCFLHSFFSHSMYKQFCTTRRYAPALPFCRCHFS